MKNPTIAAPKSPGPWVDEEVCLVCFSMYEKFRAWPDWAASADVLRQAAKREGDQGGGYRGRGSVLWVMRVTKLNAWYDEHMPCGQWWE